MACLFGPFVMTIPSLLSWAETVLANAHVSSPRVDAEWILAHVLNSKRSELLFQSSPSPALLETYQQLVAQRAQRIPLQHLLGETEFYGLSFHISPNALIPRPDTETLIEVAVHHLKTFVAPRILDIGTGSGIIAITLAHELPKARVTALDISSLALSLAHQNAQHNQVGNRVHFVQSDLFSALKAEQSFDAIVSNPPYIRAHHIERLEPEVQDHDPHLALDGGKDGLKFYRKIIPNSLAHLKPHGILALEIGHDQAEAVQSLFKLHPEFSNISMVKDLSDNPRVVFGMCAQDQTPIKRP